MTSPEGLFTANAPILQVGVVGRVKFSTRLGASETLTRTAEDERPFGPWSLVVLVLARRSCRP
eukprot:2364613-Pleurochrysis_carterae.AAC.1